MPRRYTTRKEDAAFLTALMDDQVRDWRVGDACAPYRGIEPTTIAAFDGDIVTLANGEQMHRSRLRSPRR